jgi:hypothetical protein
MAASVRAHIPEGSRYAWFLSKGNPIGDPQVQVTNAAPEDVHAWLDSIRTVDRTAGVVAPDTALN